MAVAPWIGYRSERQPEAGSELSEVGAAVDGAVGIVVERAARDRAAENVAEGGEVGAAVDSAVAVDVAEETVKDGADVAEIRDRDLPEAVGERAGLHARAAGIVEAE